MQITLNKMALNNQAEENEMIGSENLSSLNRLKDKIQASWSKLTDDDFEIHGIQRQHIVLKLQEKYGLKKEKAENALKDWEIKNRSFL